jgi:hypothetical protein
MYSVWEAADAARAEMLRGWTSDLSRSLASLALTAAAHICLDPMSRVRIKMPNRPSLSLLLAAIGLLICSVPVPAAKGLSPDEKLVIAPLQALLDGLAKRDRELIAAQILPGGSATLMRNGKPVQMGFDEFVARLSEPGTDAREEDIFDPQIRIDDNIATIWTRYTVLVNGKVHHCGTDIVDLVKVEGRWLISFVGDNSRTNCKL